MVAVHGESFTPDESMLLTPFVTNMDRPIFGLRNLPEVVRGALFSRYSRSDKSLRRILLDEFIRAPEMGFQRIVGNMDANQSEQTVAIARAEAFYDRVLIGYGDDSVAELGGAHVACEGISNIVAKAIEDSRIGMSPLEKSTRYVAFDRKVGDHFRYYIEPTVINSRHADAYIAALDKLFNTYSSLIEPVTRWIQARSPRGAETSVRAYERATKAKALDLLRGLLPMATLTNVGLFGNGRSFEYLLVKLAASPLIEVREVGDDIQHELDMMIPSFVKRAKSARGKDHAHYLAATRRRTAAIAHDLLGENRPDPEPAIQLIEYDPEAETKIIAAALYPHSDLPHNQVRAHVMRLSPKERTHVLTAAVGERGSRFHRPGRAFEEVFYTFDLLADIGAYRDLHRHRMLTQERQRFTVRHGYDIPREILNAGLSPQYAAALDHVATVVEDIAADLPDAAQYAVPFAFRVRWRMKLNLREAYHLLELRTSRQGHPSYRLLAQEMYRQIEAVHPTLAIGMSFVDLNDYDLERLASEQRIEEKRAETHE